MSVPAQRLTAVDVYHYIDWTREAFAAGDDFYEVETFDPEWGRLRLRLRSKLDFHIGRLERVVALMPDPFHTDATNLIAKLKRARISTTVDVPNVLADLRTVVAYWDQHKRELAERRRNHDQEVA